MSHFLCSSRLTENPDGHLSFRYVFFPFLAIEDCDTLCFFLSAFVLLKTWGQAGSGCIVLIGLSPYLVPSVLLFPLGGISLC